MSIGERFDFSIVLVAIEMLIVPIVILVWCVCVFPVTYGVVPASVVLAC